jgi:hypothetical protein
MSNNQKPNERDQIAQFVKHLGEKNYAKANEFLKKTIEKKLSDKISHHKSINIFKK